MGHNKLAQACYQSGSILHCLTNVVVELIFPNLVDKLLKESYEQISQHVEDYDQIYPESLILKEDLKCAKIRSR